MVANMSFAPVCLVMPGAEMKNEVAAAGRITVLQQRLLLVTHSASIRNAAGQENF